MSIEFGTSISPAKNGTSEKALSLKEKFEWPVVYLKANAAVLGMERNLVQTIKPEYPKNYKETILEMAKRPEIAGEPDNIFVMCSNHPALPDGGITAFLSKDLTDTINSKEITKGFLGWELTISASLKKGFQNLFIKEFVRSAEKKLHKYYLTFNEFTREKDKNVYQMESENETYMNGIQSIARRDPFRKADGLAFYLPGGMEEGRIIEEGENKGKVKGLQELHCKSFHELMFILKMRYHRDPVILSFGFKGSNKILDPSDDNKPTDIARETVLKFRKPKESILKVKAGMPFDYFDLVRKAEQEKGYKITLRSIRDNEEHAKALDDKMGHKLAELVDSEMRGFYA